MAKRTVKRVVKKTKRVAAARYLYVEARGWFNEFDTNTGDIAQALDGPISFDSIIVGAADEETAYRIGADALTARQQDESDNYVQEGDVEEGEELQVGETVPGSHCSGDFLNDYVVKL